MVQRGNRNVKDCTGRCYGCRDVGGSQRAVAAPTDCRNDVIGVDRGFPTTLHDRLLHPLHGIFGQQLQDPNVLARPGREALAPL
jgi:hypothetical protein